MFRRKTRNSSDILRDFVFGDAAADLWLENVDSGSPPPWSQFIEARTLNVSGHTAEALAIWRSIAESPDVDSRVALQAWSFIRSAEAAAPSVRSKQVLGVVAEVPMKRGHDLIAAYSDGSVRYLNVSGNSVAIEDRSIDSIRAAVQTWIDRGNDLVLQIGPWEEPEMPVLRDNEARITILTPSGRHFGQAPLESLMSDGLARPFLEAGTTLLLLVTDLAQSTPGIDF